MKEKNNIKPSLKEIKEIAQMRLDKYREEHKQEHNKGKVMELDR